MRGQASVFNGCCRIYAPRYRQATLYAFMDQEGNGAKALELAYNDVLASFEHYLARWNDGRPFILAGHSQGSYHLNRLLRERLAGSPEEARFVAAYLVGASVSEAAYQNLSIDVCGDEQATGCFVVWNSVGPNARRHRSGDDFICVNPLSWRHDGLRVPAADNTGSLQWPFKLFPRSREEPTKPPLEKHVADARCDNGRLLVTEIHSERFNQRPMGPDNYHIYDYGLFWDSLRRNAATRIDAFFHTRSADAVSGN
jgi:hypothetical protein